MKFLEIIVWPQIILFTLNIPTAGLGGPVGCASDRESGGCGFDPYRVGNIISWRFDHEIFSTVILSIPLIQEGQLSVSGEECAQYWLTA